MTITIPDNLFDRLKLEASELGKTIEERAIDILESSIAPESNFDKAYIDQGLQDIKALLTKIPCVQFVATSKIGEPFWWLKFGIDINSEIAWNVVQELGHILNYLAVDEKLPTTFYPVSPPPYLNGGPEEFLSWIIEPSIPFVDTNSIHTYLEVRLPESYDKEENWHFDGE
jgi:plasmid stability protein